MVIGIGAHMMNRGAHDAEKQRLIAKTDRADRGIGPSLNVLRLNESAGEKMVESGHAVAFARAGDAEVEAREWMEGINVAKQMFEMLGAVATVGTQGGIGFGASPRQGVDPGDGNQPGTHHDLELSLAQ